MKKVQDKKVLFNEKFEMKTMVECNEDRTVFRPKPSQLKLVVPGEERSQIEILGSINLNIAEYA